MDPTTESHSSPKSPESNTGASASPDTKTASSDNLPALQNQDAVTTEYVKQLVEIMDVTQKRREVLDLLIWNQVSLFVMFTTLLFSTSLPRQLLEIRLLDELARQHIELNPRLAEDCLRRNTPLRPTLRTRAPSAATSSRVSGRR